MGRKAISEYQVKFSKQSNAGKHWYIIGRPNGQRRRAWFPTKETARAEATERNNRMRQFGESAVTLSGVLANMAIECQTQLQKYDKNLSDATRFYLQHLEALDNSIPLHQLTAAIRAEFQRRLAAGECSHRHWEGMRYALRKLDEQYGQRDAQTLQGGEIKSWLAGSKWAIQTRNGLLAYFSNAFSIAKELKLLEANPLLDIKRFASSKVSKKLFPKFLTVPQITALLNAADPQLIHYLGLCAFAGLRSAECKSLTWAAVDLERNVIVVPENISKTGQERTIPISNNLRAWLIRGEFTCDDYIYPRSGHSETLNQLLRSAKQAAGLWPWKPKFQNALRKSFCSYHYEMHGSADRTAEYAGHDIRMLIRIYKHAVDHGEAVKYWQIFP
jgi:integrase